jgi:translocation and assembly module TamB
MSFASKLAGLGRYCLMAFLLLMLLFSAALWYVTTDSFQQMVRGRLIAALERATGGRVELGSFHAVPLRFQVEVRNLTIHGKESSSELPLAHVDSMSAVVNISSALGARLAFHSLTLDHPVVHVIFYADGSTNQPVPTAHAGSDLTQLFSTSIDRLEVRRGELVIQDQQVPFEFISNDVSAGLNYSFLRRRYSGNAAVGRAETQIDGYRPVAWKGQLAFSIDSSGVQINSLTATAGTSTLQAWGSVSGFRNPVFQGNYRVALNLQQFGAIARRDELKSGTLGIQGTISSSKKSFVGEGSFDLLDASWQDRNINAKNAAAKGSFHIDPDKIELSRVEGRFLRGGFSAEAEILDWHAPAIISEKSKKEQRGSVKIQVKDLSLPDLLASAGPRFRPVRNLRFAGDLSGSSEMHWRGSLDNAEIAASMNVVAPNRVMPGQTPLAAGARLAYHARQSSLEIGDLAANTPATQVKASGTLANSATSVRISFASTDIREWQPFISLMFPSGVPVNIHGRAAFDGTAVGALSNLTIAGRVQLQNFDAAFGQDPSSAPFHVDTLAADVRASSRDLNLRDGKLQSGATSLKMDGGIGLTGWKVTPASPMHLQLDIDNADAAELAAQVTTDTPLTGRINAHLEVAGTKSNPQAKGNLTWQNGSVQGYAFDALTAGISLDGPQFGFTNLQLSRGESHIDGHGTYDLGAQTFKINLSGANFSVAELIPLQRSRVKLGGALDFAADVSGTRARPEVNAHLHFRSVTFNSEPAGDYWLDAVTHGEDLHLSGHSDFKTAQLTVNGDVHLREQWPAHIELNFFRLDVDPFIESYLRSHITGHSSVAGNLVLQGPLRDFSGLTVTGNLSEISAEVERVKLHNEGPVQFSISGGVLNLKQLHIIAPSTDFSANGTIQLSGERKLDMQMRGVIGLELVQTYNPDFTGSGAVKIDSNLNGTTSSPLLHGKLQIENASLSDINLPSALSALNGTLTFNQNQVTIQSLTAQTGGGTVTFGGHAELVGRQVNFDLNATANAVRLRYPPGVSSTATANLRWNGSTAASLLSGDVTVIKLGVTPGFDFGAYLQKTVQQSSLPQTDPVLNRIRLDLHVSTTPELQMQTNVVRLRGDADLRVRGNAAKPVLLGRANIFEGEAYFNGTKYRLERGGVTFGTPAANNPAGTVPYIDFEATTRVRDYDITLSINGPADRPKLSYRSEPPLPTNDIIGLLAFGGTSEESAMLQQNSQSAFSQQASNAMLAAALNATLNNRAQRLFGNSRIKIDPQGLKTETSPTQNGPAVTIEQQVKDNLTVTYTTNVSQTSQQIIRAEYNLSRNISIVVIRDQNSVISFDVKLRRRKR